MRILIADDSLSIRQSLRFILEQKGYHVVEAIDGEGALEKLHQLPFDCIITDINMPKLNGIEFIEKARSTKAGKYIPILVLTTETQRQLLEKGKKAGATAWIIKPFNNEKLLTALKKILNS